MRQPVFYYCDFMNIWQFTPPQPGGKPCRIAVLRYVGFFLFSFFLLAFLSPDSFLTHLCTMREDSAWFFTCGKAWMEGMTPYVDFADSKGPLLWLIYGVGYLLSPTSYIGVFWLSVLAYTVSFDAVWRMARLFVGRREALLVLALMPAMIFFRIFHDEVRAEDFCMPWICIGLYCTCRVLMSPQGTSVRKYAFWLGMGMAWCLLIKWNLFVLMGGMALVVQGVSFGRKRADGLLFGLLGIAALVLPFVVFFLWKGNLVAMVQEYFINTFLTTGRGKDTGEWRTIIYNMLTDRTAAYQATMLAGVILGVILFCRRFRLSRWLLLAYVPFFLGFTLQPIWYYYFAVVMPFYMFFLIYIVDGCSRFICALPQTAAAIVVIAVCLAGTAYNTRWWNFVFFPSVDQKQWDEIQLVMQRKQYPRILVVSGDYGYGILACALPACKYWALQNNSGENIKEERYNAIRAQKPDFVLVSDRMGNEKKAKFAKFFTVLRESGYRQCRIRVVKDGKALLKAVPVYAKE